MARKILQSEGVRQAGLSLTFVTHQKIRALNQKYLRRNYATDVLAFDVGESRSPLLGDVIISTDAALRYSRSHKTPLDAEIALYVIHGILHLLGFDDHKPGDVKRMRGKEQELLRALRRFVPRILAR